MYLNDCIHSALYHLNLTPNSLIRPHVMGLSNHLYIGGKYFIVVDLPVSWVVWTMK